MATRKIVQICGRGQSSIVALCDDGTLWGSTSTRWHQIDGPPGTQPDPPKPAPIPMAPEPVRLAILPCPTCNRTPELERVGDDYSISCCDLQNRAGNGPTAIADWNATAGGRTWLRCPYCGKLPRIVSWYGVWRANCCHDWGVAYPIDTGHTDIAAARKEWNRRADPANAPVVRLRNANTQTLPIIIDEPGTYRRRDGFITYIAQRSEGDGIWMAGCGYLYHESGRHVVNKDGKPAGPIHAFDIVSKICADPTISNKPNSEE